MDKNENGIDVPYFEKNLAKVTDDLHLYRPQELARALTRLAMTAHSETAVNTVAGIEQAKGCERCRKV